MRVGKSVNNGSNGGSVSGISVGGLAYASKDLGRAKIVGSAEPAENVEGAFPGPFRPARGNATPPNPALGDGTLDPEVRVRRQSITRLIQAGSDRSPTPLPGPEHFFLGTMTSTTTRGFVISLRNRSTTGWRMHHLRFGPMPLEPPSKRIPNGS